MAQARNRILICAMAIHASLIAINFHCAVAVAQEARPIAERPWAAMWMSSLAKLLASCDVIYDSVNRPDLSESLEDRLKFTDFQGIDRTRPLGMMWTWDELHDPPATIFVPVQKIEDLMKTATFGVVDYHKVKEDQWEIERPGAPYHVIVRSGYALFGEEIPALNALREAPERLTRDLREKYDFVLMLDQRQVPRDSKQLWIDVVRRQFEPWLQPQDDEPVESATVRRALGKGLLDAFEQLIQDVQSVTIAGRIDGRTRQLQIDITVQAEPGTTMAAELNRMVVQRSEFSALVNRDASAGLAINWPVMLLGKDLAAVAGKSDRGGRLDLGIQLVGSDWSDMTLIAGIRGTEAIALNAVMPHFLSRMEKSPEFTSIKRTVANHRGVDLHSVVPARIPDLLQAVAPPEMELLIGQGKQTVWFGAGLPDTLLPRLSAAIDAVEDTPATDKNNAVMQARLSVGNWPKVIPLVDPQDTREELKDSKDGFSLTVRPVQNGLKVQIAAEEGLLRVIGRHWSKQVDRDQAFQ